MYKWRGSPQCPSVVDVTSEDCTLLITFDNGDEGVFDMRRHLGGAAFHGIVTSEDLKKAHVSNGTIHWGGGVALDPDYLYARCMTQKV